LIFYRKAIVIGFGIGTLKQIQNKSVIIFVIGKCCFKEVVGGCFFRFGVLYYIQEAGKDASII